VKVTTSKYQHCYWCFLPRQRPVEGEVSRANRVSHWKPEQTAPHMTVESLFAMVGLAANASCGTKGPTPHLSTESAVTLSSQIVQLERMSAIAVTKRAQMCEMLPGLFRLLSQQYELPILMQAYYLRSESTATNLALWTRRHG
jgi:hypothetical protein